MSDNPVLEVTEYKYDKKNKALIKVTTINDAPLSLIRLNVYIDLTRSTIKNETINATTNDTYNIEERQLGMEDMYIFREIIDCNQIIGNTDLTPALLASDYFTRFLGYKAGTFEIPYTNPVLKMIYGIPSMIVPYYMVDFQISARPSYTIDFLNQYAKNNSLILLFVRIIARNIIVIPGLIVSPIFYLVVFLALKKTQQ